MIFWETGPGILLDPGLILGHQVIMHLKLSTVSWALLDLLSYKIGPTAGRHKIEMASLVLSLSTV